MKICDGSGEMVCRTEHETSCTTREVEVSEGEKVGDTKCVPVPVSVCGAGCRTQEGEEECKEELVDTVIEVPREQCDIVPRKICSQVTKLVPNLKPRKECAMVPSEICTMNFGKKKIVEKPLKTEWCLDQESVDREIRNVRQLSS